MKRVLSAFLLISLLMSSFTVIVNASTSVADDTVIEVKAEDGALAKELLYFSCVYDAENKKVNVSGTMKHDAFAEYKDASLEIFIIPPNKTELDIAKDPNAKPLAQASVSIKFGFTFKISKLIDRYSKYAIFLRDSDGELTLAANAQYADVPSSYKPDKNKTLFKGISGEYVYQASNVDAGMTIIPLYLDMLFTNTSNGYVYQGENKQLFFSQSYIDYLDRRINSASISGSGIYLQLLLRSGGEFVTVGANSAEYILPQVYVENSLVLLHSAIDFLAERYATLDRIDSFGFVVGKGWDEYKKYNFAQNVTFEKYVEFCALYATVVANTARSVDPEINIVLPFTGNNFGTDAESPNNDSFSVNRLLEALTEYFSKSFSSGLDFSLLIETENVPFNISNQNIDDGVDMVYTDPENAFCVNRFADFSSFVKSLDAKYVANLTDCIFVWTPAQTLTGNALTVAYAYSFYRLRLDESVTSFVINLDNHTAEEFSNLTNIIKYIDTTQSVLVTNNLLEYFGVNSWVDVLKDSDKLYFDKNVYTIPPKFNMDSEPTGSFSYFDFSKSTLLNGWYGGEGCTGIKLEYSERSQRALKAVFAFSGAQRGELVYDYEYTENMKYTPYLDFAMQINDDTDNSLYEVTVVIESANRRFESSCIANSNEEFNLILDMSEYDSYGDVDNIKIFVRSLFGNVSKGTMWLYNITGHSYSYDSEELSNIIFEAREKTNEEGNKTEEGTTLQNIIVVVAVIVITGIFGAAIAFSTSRSNNTKTKENK